MRFVIGDIHGCHKTLDKLLGILSPSKSDTIYFLGDYIDRGPDSKAVFDIIFDTIDSGIEVIALRGNHEDMLLKSINSNMISTIWINKNGGWTTLKNFDAENVSQIPEKYIEFIKNTKYYVELPEFLLVHAGLNFTIENPFDDREAMLWTRNDVQEVDVSKTGNRPLIVGHTPVPEEKVKNSLNSAMIMLDGGCVYHKHSSGLGSLCALELDSMKLTTVTNCETS